MGTLTMDTNSLSQSLDSVNTAVSVAGEEEVRTLFVSGLPMDTKPRELYLLFRAYEGYEGSLLKVTSKNGKTASPVGFVTFTSRASAEAAKQDLQQGVRFDPDLPQRSHPATHRAPAFIHTGADLWPHPLNFASAEQLQQLQQQALLGHPALHQQLPVRSFL